MALATNTIIIPNIHFTFIVLRTGLRLKRKAPTQQDWLLGTAQQCIEVSTVLQVGYEVQLRLTYVIVLCTFSKVCHIRNTCVYVPPVTFLDPFCFCNTVALALLQYQEQGAVWLILDTNFYLLSLVAIITESVLCFSKVCVGVNNFLGGFNKVLEDGIQLREICPSDHG